MTLSSTKTGPADGTRAPRPLVPVLTGGMGLSMLALYATGALGPFIVADLGISRSALGLLPAAAFAVATAASLYAGHLTDLLGGRRAFLALVALLAAVFALLAASHTYPLLLAALALAGLPQALANPSTNRLIAAHVPASRRAEAVGVKQSGIPIATLLTGLVLPPLAEALSWRAAVALVIPVMPAMALLALRVLPRDPAPTGPLRFGLPHPPNAATRWLMAYSLFFGCGLAPLSTYLPLYAHQHLGMGETQSGALISAIGAAGIATRVMWTRFSDRLTDTPVPLLGLAVTALACTALIPAATHGGWLVWVGALGVGGCGAAATAVSMVAVTHGSGYGQTGHASALVSMGFFGGFVVGPVTFGLLADGPLGFGGAWTFAGTAFALALTCAWVGRRTLRAAI
ncbi:MULTISPECIES: MFS transporter [unclassified Streptomyces]|uniref:MFS transporter n=1 Tax=unclassified Streptomyces TaxID=2593676 RepID=UPI00278BCD78|nr:MULTISPECIES: MFS transporter [unclassified Streptomyces]